MTLAENIHGLIPCCPTCGSAWWEEHRCHYATPQGLARAEDDHA